MLVTVQRGQIWKTIVPFSGNNIGAKERPAAVIGWTAFGEEEHEGLFVVPISTFGNDATKARRGDVRPVNWVGSRLASGSFIRTRLPMMLSLRAFDFDSGPIGMLDPQDMSAILTELERIVSVPAHVAVDAPKYVEPTPGV